MCIACEDDGHMTNNKETTLASVLVFLRVSLLATGGQSSQTLCSPPRHCA